jgi:hypothetical protein
VTHGLTGVGQAASAGGAPRHPRAGNRSSVNLGEALIDCTGVRQVSSRARSD